jgi:hypothetical protein
VICMRPFTRFALHRRQSGVSKKSPVLEITLGLPVTRSRTLRSATPSEPGAAVTLIETFLSLATYPG